MLVPELSEIRKNSFSFKYALKRYPEFVEYINKKFPSDISWREKLYWYINNVNDYVVCPECGKRLGFLSIDRGYHKYCCRECKYKSDGPKEALKQTCLKKYGVMSFSKTPGFYDKVKQTCKEKYGVESILLHPDFIKKFKNTMKEKYGVEHALQSKELLEKFENTMENRYGVKYSGLSEEIRIKTENTKKEKYGDPYYSDRGKLKRTCLERYGNEYSFGSKYVIEKSKQTCLKKYGEDSYTKTEEYKKFIKKHSDEYKQKEYITKKKNGTFNTSKIEQDFKQWLIDNNINFDFQHKDDKYPFNCDFYFPDNDLYLEIQGNWTHGKHPFNPNNLDDIKTLNKWKGKNHKYHKVAIRVWTESDPLKRETARKNNLNWIEVFTNKLDDLIERVHPLII